MRAYHPYSDPDSDYTAIRANGMWYQQWQGGYDDILKSGYPRINGRTFADWVYCSERFRDIVEELSLSNISFELLDEQMRRFKKSMKRHQK